MAIETWAFHIFTSGVAPKPEDLSADLYQETYDRYLDLCPRLEQWGLDGAFFAEHHFSPLFIAPSPQLVVAAVAARTKTLRLGILGSVLALHDGRRFSEECGMLEYITHGRFEPGIGPGAGVEESVAAGISAEQIRPRYQSAAAILQKAVNGAYVTHHDQFSNLENVAFIPRMKQKPARPVWTTVMSEASARWAAERGWKICTSWLPQPFAKQVAGAYRETAKASGNPATAGMLGLRRRVFVAPTDAEAEDIVASTVDVTQLGLSSEGSKFEAADPAIAAMFSHPDDIIVGSPGTVADRIIGQCQDGGFGMFAAWGDYRAFTRDQLFRSYELLGTQVAPVLRSASVGRAGG